jgi:Carboxypeptidase regulatory-like domain/PDZ domain
MSDREMGRPRSRRSVVSIVVVSSLLAGGFVVLLARHGRTPDGRPPPGERAPSSSMSPSQSRAPRVSGEPSDEKAPGGVVEGRVVDPDGRPVPSATVTALRQLRQWKRGDPAPVMPAPGPASALPATTTASDGTFRLEVASSGSFVLGALAAGFTGTFRAGIDVERGARVTGVELKLGQGGAVLSGRFLDAGGGPIPGGRLRASGFQGSGANGGQLAGTPYAFEAPADGQGRYRVQLPPARYSLEAQADGYAPARDFTDLAGNESKDFRLDPAARIAGRLVTAGDQRPVAGAEIRAQSSERRFDVRISPVTSDGDGKFHFDALPGGSFLVSARKDDMVGTLAQPLTIAAGGQSDVEIIMSVGLAFSGMVKSVDGKPVAGAQISLRVQTPGQGGPLNDPISGRGDAAGRFRIAGLLPGNYMIIASAEGRAPKMEPLSLQASLARDLVLEGTTGVSGVVLTSNGQPAPGAEIEASVRPDGTNRMGSGDWATADSQGRFTLTRLGAGKLAIAARQGNEAATLENLPIGSGQKTDLTIKLQPGGRVSGVVSWDDGSPAAELKVVGTQRGGGRGQREVRSAADGTFTVGPFPAGDISVVVMPPGERTSWSSLARPEQVDLKVAAGEHRTGVKLVASRRSGTISGIVLGPDGQPVAGASVLASTERDGRAYKRVFDARAVTGPDGAFALESLKKGTYTIWASSPEHPEVERTGIAAGTKGVRVQMSRASSVAGVFVGPDGKPVSSYTLIALPPGKDSEQMRLRLAVDEGAATLVNDSRGAFQVARLTAGRYDLVANATDGKAARVEVSVSEGERKQGVRLVAQDGVTVQGKVVEYDSGEPLGGMVVQVAAAAVALEATTDAQGAFQLANVPALPGLIASVRSRSEQTHLFQTFTIPPAKDGHADVGTIKLIKLDPKNPHKGRLGIDFNERDGKLVINSVVPGTPAARAGIRLGDVLISVDGKTDHAAVPAALRPSDPGQEIKIVVQTPGQEPRAVTLKRVM